MSEPSKINLLLVDEQPGDLFGLEEILQSPDYVITKANSGEEALVQLLDAEFAAIVLDASMPGLGGIETAKLIRQRQKSKLTPVIFLTAYRSNEVDISEAYGSGAVDFLAKPVQPEILRSKVAVFAELYRQREQLQKLNKELSLSREAVRESSEHLKNALSSMRETNAALDAFAYSISHDLRAPLRHADAFSTYLMESSLDKLDEKELHYVSALRKSLKRMTRMIEDVLAFSRMSRKELRKVPIDMRQLAQEIVKEQQRSLGDREVEFQIDEIPEAFGDVTMLSQVWTNLISNAIKYSRNRPNAKIHVGSESGATGMTYSVQDNGAGFNPAQVDRLFGIFQRLHNDDEFEGTSSGLSIVKRVVQRHGGKVSAEGKVNDGARFAFSLPPGDEQTAQL